VDEEKVGRTVRTQAKPKEEGLQRRGRGTKTEGWYEVGDAEKWGEVSEDVLQMREKGKELGIQRKQRYSVANPQT